MRDRWSVGFPPACSLPCWGEAQVSRGCPSTALLLGVETQPCWLLIGAKRIVPGSPFSGAVACGDRQEGNESGCLCPRHIRPQTQPGVPECTRPPGQLRLGIKSCWPWQVGQSPEALSTPAPSAVLIPGSPSFPPPPLARCS